MLLFVVLLFHPLTALYSHAEPNSVTSYWVAFDDTNTYHVDNAPWQDFLDGYLHQTDDDRTLVDYQNVDENGYANLADYVQSLARLDPRQFSRAEQMAYWINLYNALTVKVVLDHPGKASIKNMGSGLFSFGPWDEKIVVIEKQPLSLNDIEHQILRPIWKDERIHYVANCASIGCPNLDPVAFQADNLEQQLDQARSQFLAHPRAMQFDTQGKLHLSSLFKWYSSDFASNERALLDYLATHRPDLAERLRTYVGKISYDYDWKLNAVAN